MSDTATRYSGQAKISIRYHDNGECYSATVTSPDGKKALKGIRLSPFDRSRISADGAEAFDKVARAAISFAEHEGLEAYADVKDNGEAEITRRAPSTRTPKVPKGVTRSRS